MGSNIVRSSLLRSHHTLTVVGDKAYVFGGQTSQGKLATNTIHSIALPTASTATPEYQVLPAIAAEEGPVPAPRTRLSACALDNYIAIYGGCDESGNLLDEGANIWLFNTERLYWEKIGPTSHPERVPPPRRDGKLLAHSGNLLLLGGQDSNGAALTDVVGNIGRCFSET